MSRVAMFNLLVVVALLASGSAASAQFPMNVEFMAAPVAFDTETVTGAPYSAEAVTEVVQTLADGNRIVRQSKAQLARDAAGRTRREQGLAMIGPMINTLDEFRHVQITDPEAGTMVILNFRDKTAEKMPAPNVRVFTEGVGAGRGVGVGRGAVVSRKVEIGGQVSTDTLEMALPAGPGIPGPHVMTYGTARSGPTSEGATQSLGKQFIEGVEAEGTRTTFTIPAGQIGNELPIQIVSERWYSPELKVLVMSRQSDPRSGETTYKLTNIVRGEPDPSLFEIPAGFEVVDAVPERDVIIRKFVK